MARRRRYDPLDEIDRAITGILFLFIGYLALLYYTNKSSFYHWLIYGIGTVVVITIITVVVLTIVGKTKRSRWEKLKLEMVKTGLDSELNNFITRFGRGQERSESAWTYRGYKVDWKRINEVMSEFDRRGLRINHKEFSALMKDHIDAREEEFTLKSIQSDQHNFSELNGSTFENLLQRLYSNMGYTVQLTGRTGDQGGDLVAIKDGERLLIQAKCYKNFSVGNDAVQQAVAAMKFYDCNRAAVVTTSEFTTAAITLAKANSVELIPKHSLQELLVQHLSESWR